MSRTPPQSELLEQVVWSILSEVHTTMIGKIAGRNSSHDRLVHVQPLLKTKTADGEVISRPQVTNVPIIFSGGGGFTMHADPDIGDEVVIFWSQRSHDRWIDLGREVDPKDGRKFDASDAFCMPQPCSKQSDRPLKDDAAFFGLDDLSAGFTVNGDGSLDIERDGTEILGEIKTRAQSAADAADKLLNETAATQYSAVDPNTGVWVKNAQNAIKDLSSALSDLSDAAGAIGD